MPQSRISDDFYDDEEDLISQPLIDDEITELKDGPFPKARQVFALVGFFGFAIVYAMRVNLSISIISMVNHTAIVVDTNQSLTDVCPIPTPTNSSVPAVSIFSHESPREVIISVIAFAFRKTESFCGTSIRRASF